MGCCLNGDKKAVTRLADKEHLPELGHTRLARELISGRFGPGQDVQLDENAVELGMDKESVLKACAELQALGMITLADEFSASVNPPDPKGMQEAFEVRAALEEFYDGADHNSRCIKEIQLLPQGGRTNGSVSFF